MTEQLSGPQLFLRYAWPCAYDLLGAKKIDQQDFDELKYLIENKIEPEPVFLTICFIKAVKNLRFFAKFLGINMWSPETVAEFWHNNHKNNGDCAVTKANVCTVPSDNMMTQVISGSKSFVVLNTYRLDLQIGDIVYLHKQVVIEKVE